MLARAYSFRRLRSAARGRVREDWASRSLSQRGWHGMRSVHLSSLRMSDNERHGLKKQGRMLGPPGSVDGLITGNASASIGTHECGHRLLSVLAGIALPISNASVRRHAKLSPPDRTSDSSQALRGRSGQASCHTRVIRCLRMLPRVVCLRGAAAEAGRLRAFPRPRLADHVLCTDGAPMASSHDLHACAGGASR